MHRLLTLIVAAHAGVLAGTGAAPVADGGDIDSYLRDRMEATSTPGMAYAAVTSDSIEHIGTWGSDGNGDPVTESTPFLWGSVSKPITATAVMTLVESGAIELDEPVRTYLPSFTLSDADATKRITVRHLLVQTSGIPEGTGITDRFDRRRDPYGAAVADLSEVALLSEPGERHEYTSANYVVLGAIVEAASGRSFTEYLRQHVLQPLEMDGVITSPDEAAAGLPDGHAYALGRPIAATPSYDQTGPSYGYLGGTVEDLARFAMDQLGARVGGSRVLENSSVSQLQNGTARISDTHRYGLGWRDDDRNADLGTRTIWHGGAVHGYQAMVVLLPDTDRGIVVLQNIYGFFQDAQLAAAGLGAAR
ncbi:MAG: serine hydrolase, partial [Nitriliruptorales bacterium]|nr:serine hydrolase [Nitriliruptorales bacterium]